VPVLRPAFRFPRLGGRHTPALPIVPLQLLLFRPCASYAVYDDARAGAVVLLKYEGVKRLSGWFGAQLAETVQQDAEAWRADLVIPVPLPADHLRERVHKHVAKRLSLEFGAYLLKRTKPRQPVLSRTERWTSVRGAYATREGAEVDNLRILLIDDVLTTGATLDACSWAVKKARAAAVLGLTCGEGRSRPGPLWVLGRIGASRSRNRIGPKSISLVGRFWVGLSKGGPGLDEQSA
jgi:predicted amidophosphoribosyltransferase